MTTAAEPAESRGTSSGLRERKKDPALQQNIPARVNGIDLEAHPHDDTKKVQVTWGRTPDSTGRLSYPSRLTGSSISRPANPRRPLIDFQPNETKVVL